MNDTIQTIKVTAEYTDCPKKAKLWLEELSQYDTIACDFEAAIKYTPEELALLAGVKADESLPLKERRFAEAVLKATPLDHPAHVKVTHLSVAWSDSEAYVFILESQEITDLIMDFLITTEITQIWHNACYDFRLLYYATDAFPKNYEDSQIFAKTIFNHVEVFKAKTGLKELAGTVYGAWGIAIEDYFTIANMYNDKLLHYAATDACATFWVYQKLAFSFEEEGVVYPKTSEDYSPWEQLPAGNPMTTRYPEAHFYHHTAKWLIKDTVKIMMNGLPINLDKVQFLEERLVAVLSDVKERLSNSAAVARLCKLRYEKQVEKYISKQKSGMRTPFDYEADFNSKKVPHRCFFMDEFASKVGIDLPEEKLPLGCSKWSARLVKTLSKKYPPLNALVTHEVSPSNPTAKAAMHHFAVASAEKYNKSYEEKIAALDIPYPEYNPGSSQQTQELFEMLGITSDKVSKKTGAASWDREQVEHLNKITVDEDVKEVTQCLIDFSFAAIVKNNFIQAFYKYTLEGELYGQYNLLGAKSG